MNAKIDELKSLAAEPVPSEPQAAATHAERLRMALREAASIMSEQLARDGDMVGQAVVAAIAEHGPARFASALRSAREHSFSWHRTPIGVYLDVRLSLGEVQIP